MGGCCPSPQLPTARPGGLAVALSGPAPAALRWPRRPPQGEERERSGGRERERWGQRGCCPPSTSGHGLALPGRGQASPGHAARGTKEAALGAAPPDRGGHAGRPSRGEGKRKRKEKEKEKKKKKKKRKRKEGLAGVAGRRRSLAGGVGVDGGGGQFLGRKREREVGEIEGWRRKRRR